MATSRSTLQLIGESRRAAQFSKAKVKAQGADPKPLQDWNYEDVVSWLNQVEGISESIVKEFSDNLVTGRELLSFDIEALKDFGVTRKGTAYLLLNEIKKFKKASSASYILVEHNAYCFRKVIDQLRIEGYYAKGLVKTKPSALVVRGSERSIKKSWNISSQETG
ncbi:hypothetical protein ACHAWX_000838 [Stephanocyclus meneghinianus]